MPKDFVWWDLRKLEVDKWLVKIVQSMYGNVPCRVTANGTFSDNFLVHIELYQGSVLSPLFIIVLEAMSREIR